MVPYQCVFLDTPFSNLLLGMYQSIRSTADRSTLISQLQTLFTTQANPNPVLPCLSVRTGLDLYLRVMNFPEGSEIIMTAINIPDVATVIKHHGIEIVPIDVTTSTCAPKLELINHLVTKKTVAILVAHIYGKIIDMDPIIREAKKHKLVVIEDCAETFSGFGNLGHPESDVTLFSFGVIKYYTAFGGAILKVRERRIYEAMETMYNCYPVRPRKIYLKKLLKYSVVFLGLNCPRFIRPGTWVLNQLRVNYKEGAVKMLRGFPGNLVDQLRYQPSDALLFMMHHRLSNFDQSDFDVSRVKGDYVTCKLPRFMCQVGSDAHVRNYWLFPVLVDDPVEFMKRLQQRGIDAYRGATQLNVMQATNPANETSEDQVYFPREAKFLIDHVVYLPVNKTVPFDVLDQMCDTVNDIIQDMTSFKSTFCEKQVTFRIQSNL